MSHDRFTRDLLRTGARLESASAPDVVTLGWLQAECGTLERALGLQTDFVWPPGAREEVERLKPVLDTTSGMQLWALLRHIMRVRAEGLTAPKTQDTAEAARKLLTREPVVVVLAGHRVEVTGRSYAAMGHVMNHDMAAKELWFDLGRIASLQARMGGRPFWKNVRRRVRLRALHRRTWAEWMHHRAHLYANALTPSGAPASSVSDVPAWFDRATREDDAVLLQALLETGPGRYARLGPAPHREKKGRGPAEDFGFSSLILAFDPEARLRPAELFDRDLGEMLAQMRVIAREELGEDA